MSSNEIMGFSQHQSFYFREKWLEKIFSFYDLHKSDSKKELFHVDNYYKIGVGKNMFESIKYWIKAFGLFDKDFIMTGLGEVIRDNDPMLLDNNSLSILHSELVSNKTDSSFWYWFFNEHSGSILYKENIYSDSSVSGWAKTNFKKVSNNSLRKDLLCMVQMYTAIENRDDPEDTLFSPFYRLELISETEHAIIKNHQNYEKVGIVALFYNLLSFLDQKKVRTINVEEIVSLNGLWGKIFLLDKPNIIRALVEIKTNFPKLLSFNQTSRLDIVTVTKTNKYDFLREHLGKINEKY